VHQTAQNLNGQNANNVGHGHKVAREARQVSGLLWEITENYKYSCAYSDYPLKNVHYEGTHDEFHLLITVPTFHKPFLPFVKLVNNT